MGQSDFILSDNTDTTSVSLYESYDAIFSFEKCIDLFTPLSLTSSSETNDELDNTVIESLLKTEQDNDVKSTKNVTTIVTRKSMKKSKPIPLLNVLRTDPKKKGLSMAKFNKVKDRMVVTAKKGVVRVIFQ